MRTGRLKRTSTAAPKAAAEPSDLERIDWLLGFLSRDLVTLRPGESFDLQADVRQFLRFCSTDASLDHSPKQKPITVADVMRKQLLVRVQADLRGGAQLLETTGKWSLFDRSPTVIIQHQSGPKGLAHKDPPEWVFVRRADGRVERRFEGDEPTVLLASAADLLMRWWPQLRRCGQCGALFRPRHGRQRFHDATCAFRARWSKFKPTRTRDYHAEYKRRLQRQLPGAKLKLQRRSRLATSSSD